MSDLSVVRWTRYGKDRLYVNDGTGTSLGYVDAATDALVASDPAHAELIRAAVEQSRPGGTVHASATVKPGPAVASVPQPAWTDLATNRPGQAARARADEELAAMREQSRIGTWLARTFDVKTEERAWRVGADGEETIGGKVDKLTNHGWHVLHSVPVGNRGSDIDHVLIGPGGVFTINTKKHPGKKIWVGGNTIMVSGHRVPYVRNSEHEAERASRLLSQRTGSPVDARAVLIFTTGTIIPDVTIKAPPTNVAILDRVDVPRVFKRAERRLTPTQVEAIFAVARRSTTWTPASGSEPDHASSSAIRGRG